MYPNKILALGALIAIFSVPACAEDKKCQTGDPFPYVSPYSTNTCPPEIQDWMNRVNACAHFAGEEATDVERKAFLDAEMQKNKCDAIGCDFETIFAKHEGDIVYTGILTQYAALVYGESMDSLPACDKKE